MATATSAAAHPNCRARKSTPSGVCSRTESRQSPLGGSATPLPTGRSRRGPGRQPVAVGHEDHGAGKSSSAGNTHWPADMQPERFPALPIAPSHQPGWRPHGPAPTMPCASDPASVGESAAPRRTPRQDQLHRRTRRPVSVPAAHRKTRRRTIAKPWPSGLRVKFLSRNSGSCKDYSEPLQQKCDALNSAANIRFTAAWLSSPAPAFYAGI